jgi:hypothetical protein
MKVRTVNFQGNSFSGSRADTWGRTDGHDEGNRRFSRISKGAKNEYVLRCLRVPKSRVSFWCAGRKIGRLLRSAAALRKKIGVHDDNCCVIYLGSIPWRARNLSHLQSAQTGSMAHPMSTGESFPGGESAGIWNQPLTPSSVKVTNK